MTRRASTRRPRACCPRCGGRLLFERELHGIEPVCLACGWRPTRRVDAIDRQALRTTHAGRHIDPATREAY